MGIAESSLLAFNERRYGNGLAVLYPCASFGSDFWSFFTTAHAIERVQKWGVKRCMDVHFPQIFTRSSSW